MAHILQLKLSKINTGTFLREHLNLLSLNYRRQIAIAIYLFRSFKGLCPNIVKNLLMKQSSGHNKETKGAKYNFIVRPASKTFESIGARIWNIIPVEIRRVESIHQFKSKYKEYIQQISNGDSGI